MLALQRFSTHLQRPVNNTQSHAVEAADWPVYHDVLSPPFAYCLLHIQGSDDDDVGLNSFFGLTTIQ